MEERKKKSFQPLVTFETRCHSELILLLNKHVTVAKSYHRLLLFKSVLEKFGILKVVF